MMLTTTRMTTGQKTNVSAPGEIVYKWLPE